MKKARGELRAVCRCELPVINEDIDLDVYANIFDKDNECVAKVKVVWKLGQAKDI